MLLTGLTVNAQAETLTWNGGTMTWNTTDNNWLSGETDTQFTDGSAVVFGDKGSGSVTLDGTLAPASVEVTSYNDYTFSGDGKLTGSMQLVKDGKGTLTINTANNYTGGTLIKGGTVVLDYDCTKGTGDIKLIGGALDLHGNQLSADAVDLSGVASIGNGHLLGQLFVPEETKLTFLPNTTIGGFLRLGNHTTLNLGGNAVESHFIYANIIRVDTTIGNGSIEGDLDLISAKINLLPNTALFCDNLRMTNAFLDLNRNVLSSHNLQVLSNTVIGNGAIMMAHTRIEEYGHLKLLPNTELMGYVDLLRNSSIDLGGNAFSGTLFAIGNNLIYNGTLNGSISLIPGPSVTLSGITITGTIQIADNRANLILAGTSLSGGTIKAGTTSIELLQKEKTAWLPALTVSEKEIVGTDRRSRADGLYIKSEADLLIESMTLTANNEIHVGDNTITLKDVTIKISDDVCTLVNGIYTIDLKSLINCDLVMQNVLLDASDLTLPEGFDPATTSVVFDFGDDVTIQQATGLDMRLGNYWSSTANLDTQGQVLFTSLVPTPEPTTGTLSLLALAALTARRRRKQTC